MPFALKRDQKQKQEVLVGCFERCVWTSWASAKTNVQFSGALYKKNNLIVAILWISQNEHVGQDPCLSNEYG